MLQEARTKYGHRYNKRNEYEMLYQKFGDPAVNPELFFSEFLLILAKESKLPASVRYTVKKVVDRAVDVFLNDYFKRQQAKKTKKEKKQ